MIGAEKLGELLGAGRDGMDEGLLVVPSPGRESLNRGGASLDFRLGRWFLCIQQTRTSVFDLNQEHPLEEFEARESKMYYIPFGERFVVHPGRFVLASTLEWVKMPRSIGGLITGKSTIGRRGLVIETAAGLHPGFSGCITLELSNCGEVPIALVPGMKICQVFFHDIVGDSGKNKTSVGGRRKPTFGPYAPDSMLKRVNERGSQRLPL